MSKVVIPISVELGNSLNQIKKVDQSFQDLAKNAAKPITGSVSDAPFKSIKQQLREANVELQNAVANFGKLSPQAQDVAQKVAGLRDVIEDSNRAAQAGDIDDAFQVAGRAVAGVAGAFQSVLAIQGLFGDQSKATEEALKKVQAAMALTQGITAITEGKKALEALGAASTKAFANLVTGIASATGASRVLATAIAATGIGALAIGVGFVINKISEWTSGTESQEDAQKRLNKEIEDTNRNLDQNIRSLDYALEAQTLNAQIEGKSQVELLKIQKQVNDEKAAALRISKQQAEAITIATKTVDEQRQAYKAESEIADRYYDALLNSTLIDKKIKLAEIEEEKKLSDKKEKELKDRIEKFKRAQEEANKVLLELNRRGATETQQAIFKVQDEYAQKRKTLAAAGIKDFTALNKAEKEDILKIEKQSVADGINARKDYNKFLEKIFIEGIKKRVEKANQEAEILKDTRDLQQRAELSGIKDENKRRLQELRNAENNEMDALEKKYQKNEINLEAFLQRQAAIEEFYKNQRSDLKTKEQEDEIKRLEEFQQTLTDAISSAADALGTALAEGADPFAAVFKSLAGSLGNYLQQLGKDAIKTSALITTLKKAIGTPQGIIAGIALVALGAAIKAAFNKKASKGFAVGGFVNGPGTETSDSIPARLSKGEYVIKAKSVRKYGANTFNKLNAGQVPVASLIMATERSTGRSGDRTTALVNRYAGIEMFSEGGLVTRQYGRDGGRATALVNRFEYIDPFAQFGRNGGSTTALVNRSSVPNIGGDNFQRGQPYIVTTKISGQDLKLVLERADRRFSNAT